MITKLCKALDYNKTTFRLKLRTRQRYFIRVAILRYWKQKGYIDGVVLGRRLGEQERFDMYAYIRMEVTE